MMTNNALPSLLPCPFCGRQGDHSDPDTMHPSGGWVDEPDGFRHYVTTWDPRKQGSCFEVNCVQHYGGCGASISGDSEEEAIAAWNRRPR